MSSKIVGDILLSFKQKLKLSPPTSLSDIYEFPQCGLLFLRFYPITGPDFSNVFSLSYVSVISVNVLDPTFAKSKLESF